MSIKEEHEAYVISHFLQYLSDSGLSSSFLEYPDQMTESSRTFKSLTTDALIQVNTDEAGTYLALDVMALTLPSGNLIYEILADKTEKLLSDNKLELKFRSFTVIEMSMLKEVYKFIELEINACPSGGTAKLDHRLEISWNVSEETEDYNRFQLELGLFKVGSSALWEQIRDENIQPLSKKAGLDGQASRAKNEGLHYILLLDCIGNGQIRQGTHFLSQLPQTYEKGILAALGENISRVDAIYLFTKSQTWELLHISGPLKKLIGEPI